MGQCQTVMGNTFKKQKKTGQTKIGQQMNCPNCGKLFSSSTSYNSVIYFFLSN